MSESATDAGMTVAAAFAGMSAARCSSRPACPDCRGRFELAAGALRLAIGASQPHHLLLLHLPRVRPAVRKPAGERIVELLTGGGVRTLRLHSTALGPV